MYRLHKFYNSNNIKLKIISAKMRENRLKWFEYAQSKTNDATVRRVENITVGGMRSRSKT